MGIEDSRSRSRPAVWSISASVNSTPAIGMARTPSPGSGASASSCWRRSGEALTNHHGPSAPRMASDDCVRGRARTPARAASHVPQRQFHCGNPPPAAEPRTRTRNGPDLARLPLVQVGSDLGAQLDDLELGLDPLHWCLLIRVLGWTSK